jgi:ubiquinone/menaquinone biosynthesis C-methylase UbiE
MQPVDWRLPSGVSKGTWESFHREDWAHEEDRWLEKTPLVQLDQEFVNEHLAGPTNGATERVADLGCGAGRVTLALARAGYSVLAVDLSQPMLDKVQVTVAAEELSVECLKSNLVHLDAISSDSYAHAVCLFSTIGMIRGAENRLAAVKEFHRILTPGGKLLLHAHQFWWNLRQYGGPKWMAQHLFDSLVLHKTELGDRFATYRGVPNFYLHSFRRRELRSLLWQAGFEIIQWRSLRGDSGGYLKAPAFFPALRTGGWLIYAQKPIRA